MLLVRVFVLTLLVVVGEAFMQDVAEARRVFNLVDPETCGCKAREECQMHLPQAERVGLTCSHLERRAGQRLFFCCNRRRPGQRVKSFEEYASQFVNRGRRPSLIPAPQQQQQQQRRPRPRPIAVPHPSPPADRMDKTQEVEDIPVPLFRYSMPKFKTLAAKEEETKKEDVAPMSGKDISGDLAKSVGSSRGGVKIALLNHRIPAPPSLDKKPEEEDKEISPRKDEDVRGNDEMSLEENEEGVFYGGKKVEEYVQCTCRREECEEGEWQNFAFGRSCGAQMVKCCREEEEEEAMAVTRVIVKEEGEEERRGWGGVWPTVALPHTLVPASVFGEEDEVVVDEAAQEEEEMQVEKYISGEGNEEGDDDDEKIVVVPRIEVVDRKEQQQQQQPNQQHQQQEQQQQHLQQNQQQQPNKQQQQQQQQNRSAQIQRQRQEAEEEAEKRRQQMLLRHREMMRRRMEAAAVARAREAARRRQMEQTWIGSAALAVEDAASGVASLLSWN